MTLDRENDLSGFANLFRKSLKEKFPVDGIARVASGWLLATRLNFESEREG